MREPGRGEDRVRSAAGRGAAWALVVAALWVGTSSASAQAPPAADAASAAALPRVEVRGKRAIDISPLPGLAVTPEQIPGNLQSATSKDLRESRALNLGDYMNSRMQGVSINDYSGNPFQMDVNYRGFTASPQIGTPQGLSVFFDGVRVNEPFGDVVNWDLIPTIAIERFDLFPGSNPLFGLNTLGGAISVRSKSGFTAPGVEASVTAGSWKRRQLQIAAGANDGMFAGFGALSLFEEDGWRDNSPSQLGQLYARGDWALERATLTASMLAASNDLVGNGLIPIELYERRPESVFTSPDQTKNQLLQFALSAAVDVSDTVNVTARVYRRKSDRRGFNGDIYEDFQDFGRRDVVIPWRRVQPSLPVCQYGPGAVPGTDAPLNGPLGSGCGLVTYEPTPDDLRPRNGGYLNPDGTQDTGVANGGTPIGLVTKTALEQVSDGVGVQLNWNLEQHKTMLGATIDRNRAAYEQRQRLGTIDATHQVLVSPDDIAPQFGAAFADVIGNRFSGRQRTSSLLASELWSPRSDLHLSLSGRYNLTKVRSDIGARARAFGGVGEVAGSLPSFIRCPSDDPSSCPAEPIVQFDPVTSQLDPVKESFTYKSFNPALGVNWLPQPGLNLFGSLSRGARVPSVVELGCALDLSLVPVSPNFPNILAPRSLVGSACSLPTTLSGDPFLPQIRSTSGELGLRQQLGRDWEWNLSLFQTDLKDDVYFVGAGSSRSYFDSIGKTRRRGLELGLRGKAGPFDLSASYSFVDATFRSPFYLLSPANSSADFDQNSRTFVGDVGFFDGVNITALTLLPSATAGLNRGLGTFRNIRVEPGARLPGIPAHNLNLTLGWRIVPQWRLSMTMVGRSRSYIRGNENNQHQPGGTDQQTGQLYCSTNNCALTGFEQIPVPVGRPFISGGKVPGFAQFNLDSRWQATRSLEIGLLVTNVFDRRYHTAGRLGVNPFSPPVIGQTGPSGWNYNSSEWVNTSFVGPGAPRGFFLSLSHALDL